MTLAVGANGQTVAIDASLWVLQGISGCFLGLRIYCKCYLRGVGLWYDDFFLLAAWVFLLVSCIATTINDTLGFGHHVQEIPIDNVVTMGILSNVSGTLSIIATAASKTSFAITLLRISNGFWMRTLIWFIIITLNITMNLSGIFFWVSCDPPQKTWDPLLPGTCWPETVSVYYGIVVGAYSAACDFLLALLPWRILLSFRMYRREKIGVALAMSVGVFAGITGIVKCTTIPVLESSDFTFVGTPLVIWGFAECTATIIAASIPMLRPLISRDNAATLRLEDMPSLRFGRDETKPVVVDLESPATEDPEPLRPRTISTLQHDDRSDKSILGRANRAGAEAPVSVAEPPSAYHRDREYEGDVTTYELHDLKHSLGRGR